MRVFVSWVVGIIILIFMNFLQDFLSGLWGFTTYVDYGETIIISNRYYDEEVNGHRTGIGLFFMYLSFLVAIRGGMAVYLGHINAYVSPKVNFQLLMIGIGLLIYGISNQIIYFVLDLHSGFSYILDAVIGISILYVCYKFYISRIDAMDEPDKD